MIGQYTLQQWILYFYVYCFLGWIFESCYVSFRKKEWVNRGFLHGPFLPIYGSGAVMMLFVSEPFKNNLILTYFAGVVGATLLELVTGAAMEALLKVRYWDYSNQKFNYKGYICLSSSVAWGFLTILMNEVLHPAILHVLAVIPKMADGVFVWVVSAGLAVDSPEAFVFFGGLTKAGDLIMKPIQKAYDEHVLRTFKGKAKFLVSTLDGSSAAVLGASAVAWDM